MAAVRGWRERVEPGVYRSHKLRCPASDDHQAARRCNCTWQVQVPGYEPGRTRFVAVRGTLRDAKRERHRLMAAGRAERPEPATPAAPAASQTLTELAGEYLRTMEGRLSPHTLATVEREYRLRVHPALGHLAVQEVTRDRIESWLAALVGSEARRTVIGAVAALRVILSAAVRWGRIERNPALRLHLPPAPTEAPAAERVLTADQLSVLLRAAPLRLRTMLRAAGEAGLRRGEVIGLRWADVDTAARRLAVRRSVWQGRGVRGERPTKGRRARRVAISPTLAQELGEWRQQSPGMVEGYVWPGRHGGPMDAASPTQALARLMRRVGLVDDGGRPFVSFHGLRHTAASIMLARGVPLLVVSRQLGHADPQVTAQVYAHLADDSALDAAAEAFAA